MSPRPSVIICLAATAVAIGGGVAGFIAHASRLRLEQQLAAAQAQRAGLLAIKAPAPAAKDRASMPPAGLAGAGSAAPATAAATPTALPPRKRPPGLTDLARNYPELWNEFARSKRAELGRLYLPVMLRLNLTHEERERVKDILAEQIARASDLAAAADAKGLKFNDPEIAAWREQMERQTRGELTALLGPARWPEFEAFERAIPLRGFVDGLAVQLAGTSPLTATQADALERALRAANPPFLEGKNGDPSAVDWAVVDRRAAEVLDAAQLAVWERHTAHNTFGGSRQTQDLEAVYRRAVARMKETAPGR